MNRHDSEWCDPNVSLSTAPTRLRISASNSGQRSQVMAVSNVSLTRPSDVSTPLPTPMKALRQAPTAPPRPVGAPVPSSTRMSSSAMFPPLPRAISTAAAMLWRWGEFRRLERHDHQSLLAVESGGTAGLRGVEDTQVGRPQLGLHEVADGPRSRPATTRT